MHRRIGGRTSGIARLELRRAECRRGRADAVPHVHALPDPGIDRFALSNAPTFAYHGAAGRDTQRRAWRNAWRYAYASAIDRDSGLAQRRLCRRRHRA